MLLTWHYDQRPFDETVCDALIGNGDVKNPPKKMQNICDEGYIKHSSDFSCVSDVGHTVQFSELFALSQNERNGQPDEGVCDIRHIVHSNELFVMRRNNRNGQPDEGVCDIRHTVHSDELFVIRQHKRNGQPDQGVCDIQNTVHSDELFSVRQRNRNGLAKSRCVQWRAYSSFR